MVCTFSGSGARCSKMCNRTVHTFSAIYHHNIIRRVHRAVPGCTVSEWVQPAGAQSKRLISYTDIYLCIFIRGHSEKSSDRHWWIQSISQWPIDPKLLNPKTCWVPYFFQTELGHNTWHICTWRAQVHQTEWQHMAVFNRFCTAVIWEGLCRQRHLYIVCLLCEFKY